MADPGFAISAPAKVNLFLRVLAKEDTGYHGVETLLCLVDLADDIEVVRRDAPGEVTLDVHGPDTGPAEENLAVRAAKMVLAATGNEFGVGIRLAKHIPVAAGLGGGSSDAAAVLHAVNALAGGAVPHHELLQFSARLGSDVPFLFTRSGLALAWSRGERLLTLPPLPAKPGLLLSTEGGIRTSDAYSWVDEARAGLDRRGAVALSPDTLSTWGDVARMSGNDFESAVFGRRPELRQAFEALAGTGPLMCRLSGSGSAMFAVYRTERDRDHAREALGRRHGSPVLVQTVAAPPPGPRPLSPS